MGFGSSLDRRCVVRRLVGLSFGLAATGTLRAADSLAVVTADPPRPLTLGIFPYLPALQIGRQFGPLASAFAGLCARPVSLQTKSSFPAFRQLLLDGHYDLALLHPFLFADASTVQDYRPLGRLREDLAAIVIARAEQRIERFADLRGATIAVPPRLSAVAQLVQHELKREGLTGPDGVRLTFHRTKSACLHAIASKAAMACALPGFVLDQLEQFRPIALEAKFATPGIPGILLVAHGRLGEGHVAVLREAVLGWDNASAGMELLHALGWSGLVAVRPGEYDRTSLALLVEQ